MGGVSWIKTFAAILVLVLGLAFGPFARAQVQQPQTQGETFEEIKAKAENGDAASEFKLGNAYHGGNGVAKDYGEAANWFRRAADQGNPDAQMSLAYCYYAGTGVTKHELEAVKWYRKAADQGNAQGQFTLGFFCHEGQGVAKDLVAAVEWYRKEADQGHAYAQNALGACYQYGEGVAQDRVEAVRWLSKAIELKPDFAYAYINRGNAKRGTGDLDGAITDYSEAISLDPKHSLAYYNRGILRHESHDFQNALVDFRKAAEIQPDNIYDRFRIWLVRVRLGEAEAATTELRGYLRGLSPGGQEEWATHVGRFLVGELGEPQFLAAAKNAKQKTETRRLCEAYYYAAEKRLFAGEKVAALDYFEKSVTTRMPDFTESSSAVAELKFLKAQKN
jgi:TPR repeat protein